MADFPSLCHWHRPCRCGACGCWQSLQEQTQGAPATVSRHMVRKCVVLVRNPGSGGDTSCVQGQPLCACAGGYLVPKGWPICRRHGVQSLLHLGRKGLQSLGAEVGGVLQLCRTPSILPIFLFIFGKSLSIGWSSCLRRATWRTKCHFILLIEQKKIVFALAWVIILISLVTERGFFGSPLVSFL